MPCEIHNAMRWRPAIPSKESLILLFQAARRRLTRQSGNVAELTNVRILTATTELNQITDDIRDAQDTPEEAAPAIRSEPPTAIQTETELLIHTVGKILRRSRINR